MPISDTIFLHKYLAYHMYKLTPIEEQYPESLNSVFLGPKVPLFSLKCVPWTGNKLEDDNVENC